MRAKVLNLGTALVMGGLAVFSGSYIFTAGALTVLGWSIMGPLFAGSTAILTVQLYDLGSQTYNYFKNRPAKDEKSGLKPEAQAV